jgi:phosphoglycolate phosphatase-like HAD superfamily hydrolase
MSPIPDPSIPELTPRSISAVLLDWDNTLHDSASVNFRALRTVLRRYHLEVDEDTYRAAYTTDYRTLYRRLGLTEDRIEEASEAWRTLVAGEEPRLLPGAANAVERLSEAGLRLALITTGREAIVRRQFERIPIAHRFEALSFGDGQPPRPDPGPLHELLGSLQIAAHNAALCSDTPSDMRMATAAGVRAVGLATFAFGEAELRDAGAAETARTLALWVEHWLSERERVSTG